MEKPDDIIGQIESIQDRPDLTKDEKTHLCFDAMMDSGMFDLGMEVDCERDANGNKIAVDSRVVHPKGKPED